MYNYRMLHNTREQFGQHSLTKLQLRLLFRQDAATVYYPRVVVVVDIDVIRWVERR